MIWRRAISDRSGTTAVEMALTLPAFLMLLIGGIEYGLVLWTQVSIEHGAEMAARCAAITPATCGTASQTQSFAANQSYGLNPPNSTFSVSTPACGELVSASYKFSFVTTYFTGPLTLTAYSCFPK